MPYLPSPCQVLDSPFFPNVKIWVKRDDLLHPDVSGNKMRKLKYPLLALRETQGSRPTLVSMGGPWSNHLHALAHAGALLNLSTKGLVRGADGVTTAMLDDCRNLGMQLQFVSRQAYRMLRDDSNAWRTYVDDANEAHVWLPEGGSSPQALRGVSELVDELIQEVSFVPDAIVTACGTGATTAGLLAGLKGRGRVLGIAAGKNADYLRQDIALLLQKAGHPPYQNYTLFTDFHHGGYGKISPELMQFCRNFSAQTNIPVEPVYTGKMFYALATLVKDGVFAINEKIVALHTGGLQGARGFVHVECA